MTNLSEEPKKVEDSRDVVVTNIYNLARKFHFPKKLALRITKHMNRDNERTPMQWNDSVNAGFNKGWKPWLGVNTNYLDKHINVKDEAEDHDSIYNFYKDMIKFRNESEILKKGTFVRLKSHKDVAKFVRTYKGHKLLIVINLSSHKIADNDKIDRKMLLSNYRQDFIKMMPPYFCAIYEIA